MSIDLLSKTVLSAGSVTGPVTGPATDQANTTPSTPPFSGLLREAMRNLQQLDDNATASVRGLLGGDGTDIHTALIATQKAGLAFDAALAVRNKAVAAYQQIMGMQF